MITAERWNEAADFRTETRQYFSSPAGKAFLQLLYRLSHSPITVTAAHTPEMELGRMQGWAEALRTMEGVALVTEEPIENIEANYEPVEDQTES